MPFKFNPLRGSLDIAALIFIGTTTYTPTVSNSPVGTLTARYWRIGDRLHIQGEIAVTGAGAGSVMSIPIPTAFTLDTAKIGSANNSPVGTMKFFKSGVGVYSGVAVYAGSSSINLISASKTANALVGSDFANGDIIGWEADLPVT